MEREDSLVLTLMRELDDITVADRIRQATDLRVQSRIDADIIERVACYVGAPRQLLTDRLAALEQEWNIERVLTLQSSATAIAGVLLAARGSRRWTLLTLVTSGFLMQHALRGWCPPLALHRRLGFRTQREIDLEIHMLKLLRGDYEGLPANVAPTSFREWRVL
ncbi:MAG TPA: hypothetical protein VFZ24_18500 [Longimicrobiales bacterium]